MDKAEALARDALGEYVVCEASVQQLIYEFGYTRKEAVAYMWDLEIKIKEYNS